ncbi:MAG: hypothetical protein WA160_06980 [Pseudobdellovibrio sp.]
MESSVCSVCLKPKAKLICGVCESPICKSCTQFLDEDSFAFMKTIPSELQNKTFCHPCFDSKIDPQLQKYNQDVEKAKNVFVFYRAENKESRFFKRVEQIIKVTDCTDKEETVLRLAYQAIILNCNAIVDVDLISEKIKTGSYQTSKWSGAAFPVQADPQKVERKSKN